MAEITGLDLTIREMASRIRELRLVEGLSPAQMAEKTGVSTEEYLASEAGERDLNFAFIYRCALAFSVDVTDIIEGQYRALLVDVETQEPVSLRMSDAVLLSYIAKLPIWIDAQLMEKQSVPYDREARGVAIPVNTISTEMLQNALDKAVEEEKYELASHLRDELRRRKRGVKEE